jgi:hypothetical protein
VWYIDLQSYKMVHPCDYNLHQQLPSFPNNGLRGCWKTEQRLVVPKFSPTQDRSTCITVLFIICFEE